MAILNFQITKGKIIGAQKIVIYGPEGIGKSTFAAQFPGALFIDTEGSTKHLDVARLPSPSSWTMLLEEARWVKQNPSCCQTLVIDTADWAEQQCASEICAKNQKTGIEDFGYGKGYIYVAEEFGRLLNLLEEVAQLGINIVITAHAQMRKFEQPDEMGSYDRWELKLSKKTAPMMKEWADMVLFANYKTYVVAADDKGKKHKAQGGKRVMYTSHHPCWDAKNRHDLPEELPFEYGQIAQLIQAGPAVIQPVPGGTTTTSPATIITPVATGITKTAPTSATTPVGITTSPAQTQPAQATITSGATPPAAPGPITGPGDDLSRIPKSLADLMRQSGVTIAEIQAVSAYKGYFPADTPIDKYPLDYIEGGLVAGWAKVHELILSMREDKPF